MSLGSLCIWQVQVSVYCAWWIPAYLRCTQCSTLLYLMDICFLPCICLWQISQIQTCLCVVIGPGFVSTSPAFMRNSTSHSAVPYGPLSPKNCKSDPIIVGEMCFDTTCTPVCNCCDSSVFLTIAKKNDCNQDHEHVEISARLLFLRVSLNMSFLALNNTD